MENIIRENFMAEWQIEGEINFLRKSLKSNKEYSDIEISDNQIDFVLDSLMDGISISFYKVRNNI